ncbi:hypothetical protein N7471_010396 [Penicillium samsonianum]|uniref:uncharacterized protein n=1 Tax=Penicillium samsonianum TaxID=1882272 RepID=UPI0025485A3D|nr:uncharacterized protein N7471_010396 [Penicillium samsonianum]KAJ6125903.1 hypothetical protein N7471_010396 [Penicillium samsonianum]
MAGQQTRARRENPQPQRENDDMPLLQEQGLSPPPYNTRDSTQSAPQDIPMSGTGTGFVPIDPIFHEAPPPTYGTVLEEIKQIFAFNCASYLYMRSTVFFALGSLFEADINDQSDGSNNENILNDNENNGSQP